MTSSQTAAHVDLSSYSPGGFDRGRGLLFESLWRLVSCLFFQSGWFPLYGPKRWILRCFGARVGAGVLIKPRVTITFPWKVTLGNHAWIGEEVWLDSLDTIQIGNHVCISQGAYLCTGNHDYRDPHFALRTAPIVVADSAWVAARAVVGPGVKIGEGAVLGMGSVATENLEPFGIYRGNPAQKVGTRVIRE